MSQAQRRNALPITIFPFLDVLVCTMGSLILILILLSARMRTQAAAPESAESVASAEAAPSLEPDMPEESPPVLEEPAPLVVPEPHESPSAEPPSPPELAETAPLPPEGPTPRDLDKELRERIAELSVRLDVERAALRRQQEKVLAARRRTIEAQAALHDVQKRLAAMDDGVEKDAAQTQKLDEERERLQKELEDLNRQIRMAQQKTNDVASKFAFVPYDGASGTTRRPVLIECTNTGLRFIPEDVVLTPNDIAGFSEKSNPLLAGSNALCRYWSTVDGLKSEDGEQPEPYVLLIIRPSGHLAYYYAQRMLSKLRQPHGYELLDDDDQLSLPAADPKARELCRQAVADAIAQRDRSSLAQDDDGGEFPELRRNSPGAARGGSGGLGRDPDAGMDNGGLGSGGAGSPRVARGNMASGAGGGKGEGRAMRFRPGVGFEEVESESKPAYDDPFDRANNAWESRKGGGGGASGNTLAGQPRGNGKPVGSGTGGDEWTSGSPTSTGGGAGKPRGSGAAGSGGPSFGPGNADTGTASAGSGSPGDDDPTSPFERALRDRGEAAGGSGAGGAGKGAPPKVGGSAEATGVAADGTKEPVGDSKAGGTSTASTGGPALRATTSNGSSAGSKAGTKSGVEPGGTGGTSATAKESVGGDSRMVTKSSGRGGGPSDGEEGGAGGSSSKGSSDETSAGPGANFGPLSRKRGPRGEADRRWGYYSRRASIGFQRDIPVQVLQDRLVLGQGHEIPLKEGTSVKDTVEQITEAVEVEARSWGRPPDSFYYVPTLKFVAPPGSEKSIEPLRVPLKREGLTSTVQEAAPKTAAAPADAFFPKRSAAEAPAGTAAPATETDMNRTSQPTETQNGAPSSR
jgi:hypothetical protein